MTEGWGMIVAAAVTVIGMVTAGVIAFRAGRRQVTDQAAVEHGQWLRGQRQQAYAEFLTAWDQAVSALRDQMHAISSAIPQLPALNLLRPRDDRASEILDPIGDRITEVWQGVLSANDQLALLGPDRIREAAARMVADVEEMQSVAISRVVRLLLSRQQVEEAEFTAFSEAQDAAPGHRREFLELVKGVLLTPPRP